MNCARFEELLIDVARSVPMDAALRAEAVRHGDSCDRCGAALERERSLRSAFENLAAEPVEPAPGLEDALLTEFDRMHARRPRRWIWTAVAASLALVAAGATWFALRPRQPVIAVKPAPAPGPPRQEHAVVSRDVAPPAMKAPRKTRAVRPRTTKSAEQPESDFMPLPFAEPLMPLERAQVFRVSMPRGALASFGFTVNPERASESIRADLIVGEDNTARAIRLISNSSTTRRVTDDQ